MESVISEIRGGAMWITLNRPDALNAITPAVISGINAALDKAQLSDVRAVVLTGTGRAFCVGADLKFVRGEAGNETSLSRLLDTVLLVMNRLETFPMPVIASLNGLTLAGGLIGYALASKVEMTQMPELVAGMHALVGLAAVFVGFNAHFELINVLAMDDASKKTLEGFAALLAKKTHVEINILRVEATLGIWIGAVTFTGSVVAYGKLAGRVTSAATKLPGGHLLNATAAIVSVGCMVWYLQSGDLVPLLVLTFMALFIGYHLIMGIGGADMPVVVSMLNSYSGWAAAAIGFSLGNDLLIVVGALVGSSGAILSYIMCKAMNRSFVSVILGGFGGRIRRRIRRE